MDAGRVAGYVGLAALALSKELIGRSKMSESNPYAPSVSLPSDLNAIRKASINPFHLYQRGIELIGDQYWQFLFITLVAMLIGSAVPMGLLIGVMLVGVFTCFLLREQGKRVEFADLFKML